MIIEWTYGAFQQLTRYYSTSAWTQSGGEVVVFGWVQFDGITFYVG